MTNLFPSQKPLYARLQHLVNVHVQSQGKIRPHAWVTGPTGSGKTHIAELVCEELDVPMFTINAAQLTAEGLSGNSLTKALRPLRQNWDRPNLILVDEFDKLFQRGGEAAEGFRRDVQDEFLGILEAGKASIFTDYGKYEPFPIDKTLFLFAGAFNGMRAENLTDLRDLGVRPEFIGRVPLVISAQEVNVSEIVSAIPKMPLYQEYEKLFPAANTKEKNSRLSAIAELIVLQNKNVKLGIRALNSCIHTYFMERRQ